MEVEFPASDDDSIYQSDHEIIIERPPLSPVGRPIHGYAAKVLDEQMDIIEAEEMSSDEPDDSDTDASTEALSESLDPTSDDDMLDIVNKDSMLMDDELPPPATPLSEPELMETPSRPNPTNVDVSEIVAPATSDRARDAIIKKDPELPMLAPAPPSGSTAQLPGVSTDTFFTARPYDMEDMELSSPAPALSSVPEPIEEVKQAQNELEVVPESTDNILLPETDTAESRLRISADLPDNLLENDVLTEPTSTPKAAVSSSEEVLFEAGDAMDHSPAQPQLINASDSEAEKLPNQPSESGSDKMLQEVSDKGSEKLLRTVSESGSDKMLEDVPRVGSDKFVQDESASETENMALDGAQPPTENLLREASESDEEKLSQDAAVPSSEKLQRDASESGGERLQRDASQSDSEKLQADTNEENASQRSESDLAAKLAQVLIEDTAPAESAKLATPTIPMGAESSTDSAHSDAGKSEVDSDPETKDKEDEEMDTDKNILLATDKDDPTDSETDAKFSDTIDEEKEDISGSSTPEPEQPLSFASKLASFGASVFGFASTPKEEEKESESSAKSVDVETEGPEINEVVSIKEGEEQEDDNEQKDDEDRKDDKEQKDDEDQKDVKGQEITSTSRSLPGTAVIAEGAKEAAQESSEQDVDESLDRASSKSLSTDIAEESAFDDAEDDPNQQLVSAKELSEAENQKELVEDKEVQEVVSTETSSEAEVEKESDSAEEEEEEQEMETMETLSGIESKNSLSAQEVLKSTEDLSENDSINLTVAPAMVEIETNKTVFQELDPKSPKLSSEVKRQMELSNTSLDVPDVEDIADSKKKVEAVADASGDLEDLEGTKLDEVDTVDRTPEFPEMDEIQIDKPTGVESSNKSLSVAGKAVKDEFGADAVVDDELTAKDAEIKSDDKTQPQSPVASPSKPGLPANKSFRKGAGSFMSGVTSFFRGRKSTKSKEKENQEDVNMRDTIVGGNRRADSDLSLRSIKKDKKRKTFSNKDAPSKAKMVVKEKEKDEHSVTDSATGSVRESIAASEGENYLEVRTPEEKAEEDRHLRLEETLKSQIATLRSARSGFVDLALLTPMTEKTLAAVEFEAKRILSSLPEVESRKDALSREVELLEMTTEAELMAKEKTLVAAKIKVAEAKCELDKLRHELFIFNREITEPKRAHAQQRLRLKVRREKALKELGAATESKETMSRNLEQRKAMLQTYQAEVSRLEKSVQDVAGD